MPPLCAICNDTGKLDDAQAWDCGQPPSDCPYCETRTVDPDGYCDRCQGFPLHLLGIKTANYDTGECPQCGSPTWRKAAPNAHHEAELACGHCHKPFARSFATMIDVPSNCPHCGKKLELHQIEVAQPPKEDAP